MKLLWLRDGDRVELALPEGETVLGRDRECELSLLEPSLSKRHVRFTRRGAELFVSDAGSKNGTCVAGRALEPGESRRVWDGEAVQCGKLTLVVQGGAGGAAAAGRARRDHSLEPAERRAPPRPPGAAELPPHHTGPRRPGPLEALRRASEDVRLRAAASAALLLLGLALLLRDDRPPPPPAERLAWLHEATQALEARDWPLARQRLRRSLNSGQVPLEDTAHHRAVDALAAQWSRIEPARAGWARELDWGRAAGLLERVKRRDLPPATEAWLARERAWVARHAAAEAALRQGEERALRARQALAAGSWDPALTGCREALRTLESLDPTTALAQDGAAAAAELRRATHAGLLAAARGAIAGQAPDWTLAERLAGAALDLTDEAGERDELRRLAEECRQNARDEQAYTLAVEQLRDRDPTNDGTAARALEAIDPRSRIREDAVAWLGWIGADQDARRARSAWDQGDARAAIGLLSRAAQVPSLGQAVKDEALARCRVWRQVARAWQRALDLAREDRLALDRTGRDREVAAALEEVLRLEPNRDNWFNRQAREQLAFMARQAKLSLAARIDEGLLALSLRRYDEASGWLSRVAEDPALRPIDRARIQTAVQAHKRQHQLFKRARQLTTAGATEQYPALAWELRVLAEWLPPGDDQRAALERMREDVERYLREAR